jgi:ATP-dependent protease Clp ATPase subunit
MENCSFCGKTKSEVKHLIQSEVNKSAFICDMCAKVCKGILEDDLKRKVEEVKPKPVGKIIPLFREPSDPKPA